RCAPCPLVLFVFQLPPPPPFSLFPYTTLCRSSTPLRDHALRRVWVSLRRASPPPQAQPQPQRPPLRWRLQRLLRQSPGSPHRSPWPGSMAAQAPRLLRRSPRQPDPPPPSRELPRKTRHSPREPRQPRPPAPRRSLPPSAQPP